MKKKFLIFSIIISLLPFSLVFSDWQGEGSGMQGLIADSLAEKGVIQKQKSLDLYRINSTISRAELISIALKVKGIKLSENYICQGYYSDVTKNDWICKVVEVGADNGLISRTNKKFRPNDKILNIEAFSILYKASGLTPKQKISPILEDFISKYVQTPWHKDILLKTNQSKLFINPDAIFRDGKVEYETKNITRGEVFEFVNNIFNVRNIEKNILAPTINFFDSESDHELVLERSTIKKPVDKFGTIANPFLTNNTLLYDWMSTGGRHVRAYDVEKSRVIVWLEKGNISSDGKFIYNCYKDNAYALYSLEQQKRIERYRNAKPLLPEDAGMVTPEFCRYTKDNGGTLVYPDGTKYILSQELQDPINILDTYYSLLGFRDIDLLYAYNMRKDSTVSFDTFRSWYSDDGSYFEIEAKSIRDLGDNVYEFIVLQKKHSYEDGVVGVKINIVNRYKVKSKVNIKDWTVTNISSVKI